MTGTLLNIATVIAGSVIGLIFGARIPAKLKETVIAGMGLFTVAMGLQMFLKTENPLIVLGALLIVRMTAVNRTPSRFLTINFLQ